MHNYNLYLIELEDSIITDYKKIKELEIETYLPSGDDYRLLSGFGGYLYKHETKTKKIYWIVDLNYSVNDIAVKLNPDLIKMFADYIKYIKIDLKLNSLLK